MSIDDRVLVRRVQRGDREAFAALVTRHQRYVYNLAYRLLRDTEAEDLAQEAFLRAWRGLGNFRGEAKFTAWLYRIVTNLCYNRLNSLRRQLLDTDVDDVDTLALSSDKDPAMAVEAAERRAFLHRQIAALPEKYQLVITLFYLQEFSYQEIAQVLNLPLGTVKTQMMVLLAFSLLEPQHVSTAGAFLQRTWWTLLPEIDRLWHTVRVEPAYVLWVLSTFCAAAAAAASANVLVRQWPGLWSGGRFGQRRRAYYTGGKKRREMDSGGEL